MAPTPPNDVTIRFVPQRFADVGRDFNGDCGPRKRAVQSFNAFAAAIIQLAELDEILIAGTADMTRTSNPAQRPAHAPQHMVRAEHGRKLRCRFDAILQWYYGRATTNEGLKGLGRVRHLPSLDANKHDVRAGYRCWIVGRLDWVNDGVALGRFQAQSVGAQRLEVIAARNENHLFSRQRQLCAKISAGASRAINHNTHHCLPM